jgi:phosphate transport system substrate-binding protein
MKSGFLSLLAGSLLVAGSPARAADLPIVGTGDGIEMLQALASAYSSATPGVTVLVPPSIGSGGAIASVGSDKDVLGRVARPLSDQDRAQGLRALPLVSIPSAFFVHPTAGVQGLSAAQIADIFTGRVTNWIELGGPDLRIKVVRRENSDSTLQVLRASMPGWKDLTFTERSKLAMTTQEAVQSVRETPGAIGFGPFSTALTKDLAVLRVDGRLPGEAGYPSAVTVSLIHKDATLTQEARAFLDYARTPKAKSVLASMGGVPVE